MVEGGGSLCKRPAVTTADGKHLVVAVADCVRLYGTASGTLAAVLRGHTAEVTAAVLNARNDAQIYTASKDGTVILWDYSEGEIAKQYNVGAPIARMVIPARGKYAVLTLDMGGKTGRIRHFNLAAGTLVETATRVEGLPLLTVSASGRHTATHARQTTYVWCPQQPRKPHLHVHATKAIKSVAISPQDDCLATGDTTGRIRLYRPFSDAVAAASEGQRPGHGTEVSSPGGGPTPGLPCTTWHWHAHAVLCLCFANDGAFLLSGGHEAVLVIWEVATGERSFLPRLGGSITSITPCRHDSAKFVLCQADNTIRVVNTATRAVETTVLGLQPPPGQPTMHHQRPSPALLLPKGGHLLQAAPNACLQLYSLLHDRHIDRLQVAPRNSISLTEDERAASKGPYATPAEPQVTHMACSHDASVLATLHVMPDASPQGGVSSVLQFWDRAGSGGEAEGLRPRYELNSVVTQPHTGVVTALAHHPSLALAASTGREGDLRLWERTRRRKAPGAAPQHTSHWHCRSVASFRGEPLLAAAFSQDGSLLAAAAGDSITLWDPHTNALVTTLSAPPRNRGSPFHSLAFLPKSPTLVAASGSPCPTLVAWDVASGAVRWSSGACVGGLAADPQHPCFAVTIALAGGGIEGLPNGQASARVGAGKVGGAVAVFGDKGPLPLQLWALPSDAPAWAMFAPPESELHRTGVAVSPEGMSPLVIMTSAREYTIAPHSDAQLQRAALPGAEEGPPEAVSGFKAAYGSLSDQAARQAAQRVQEAVGPQSVFARQGEKNRPPWAELFDAPSHVLPPLSTLLPSFLDLMVPREAPLAD